MLYQDADRIYHLHDRIRNSFNPNYRYCMQPNCESGQICHDINTMNCQKCNGYDCVRCDAPFHHHCASHEDYQETIRYRTLESELSLAHIENMKMDGKMMACPNCACLIESYGCATTVKCTRCIYYFQWDDKRGANDGEVFGIVDGVAAASGLEKKKKSSAGERHVTFPEDEAHHRMINPLSTKLGPETPGTGT